MMMILPSSSCIGPGGFLKNMDRQKGQQLFLQWLMSQRVCLLKEAELFYCRIFEKDDEVAEGTLNKLYRCQFHVFLGFDSFLDSCGTSLSLFGLKLQRQFLVKDDEKLEFIAIVRKQARCHDLIVLVV